MKGYFLKGMGSSIGTNNTKLKKINQFELNEFARMSDLNFEEIKDLQIYFKSIASSQRDDGVIDFTEFCTALKLEDSSLIAKRIFKMFDLNDDDVLNFREFVLGIAALINNNIDNEIKMTFEVYDLNKNGKIERDNVEKILGSALEKFSALNISEADLRLIIDATFHEVNAKHPRGGDDDEDVNYINLKQYSEMTRKNPHFLNWLKIEVNKVREGAELMMKYPKRYHKTIL